SLSGSIRILFHKVVSKVLGRPYEYPLLTATDTNGDGAVTYVKDPAIVRARVASAECILLYIHGIIGDTTVMAGSAHVPAVPSRPDLPALGSRYDLVLAFDYEN